MMTIERGDLRVQFQTLEELAEAMLYLATVFTHNLNGLPPGTNQRPCEPPEISKGKRNWRQR